MGRPTACTPERIERVLEATRKGLPRRVAAQCAGVTATTLYEWLARGRRGEAPYSDLADRIKPVEAEGEESLVDIIRAAAPKQWQAAAWLLERRYQDRYALRQRHLHEMQPMSEEQAKRKYRELTGQEWGVTGTDASRPRLTIVEDK